MSHHHHAHDISNHLVKGELKKGPELGKYASWKINGVDYYYPKASTISMYTEGSTEEFLTFKMNMKLSNVAGTSAQEYQFCIQLPLMVRVHSLNRMQFLMLKDDRAKPPAFSKSGGCIPTFYYDSNGADRKLVYDDSLAKNISPGTPQSAAQKKVANPLLNTRPMICPFINESAGNQKSTVVSGFIFPASLQQYNAMNASIKKYLGSDQQNWKRIQGEDDENSESKFGGLKLRSKVSLLVNGFYM